MILKGCLRMREKVWHTLPPLYQADSKVLILGTMPSPKSREAGFYYAHPQNRFWPVLSAVLGEPLPETIEGRREMCLRRGVALWDVLSTCEIEGASDAAIRSPEPNDIGWLLGQTQIRALFATGAKAAELYQKLVFPSVGVPVRRLPSTSPANAAWTLPRLTEAYRVIRETLDGAPDPTGSEA